MCYRALVSMAVILTNNLFLYQQRNENFNYKTKTHVPLLKTDYKFLSVDFFASVKWVLCSYFNIRLLCNILRSIRECLNLCGIKLLKNSSSYWVFQQSNWVVKTFFQAWSFEEDLEWTQQIRQTCYSLIWRPSQPNLASCSI